MTTYLLALLDIPRELLPAVRASSHVYSHTRADWRGASLPVMLPRVTAEMRLQARRSITCARFHTALVGKRRSE